MTTITAAVPVARRIRRILLHLAMIATICVLLYPVAWLIASSFKPASEILSGASLWPSRIVLSNYTEVFAGVAGVSVWRFAFNSLLISVGAVIGNVVSCSLAAYAFAWMRFRLRGPMFAFMIGTIMLPVHVLLIPQYTIFQSLGMIDTIWPLVLPKLLATDAFFIFMIVQFMRGLPRELGDAARIDGCGPIRAFLYVVLPLSKPALVTTAIFTFIWSWNDFLSQLIYLNSPETYTMPLALRLFIDQTGESSYGAMVAMSVLTLLPIALFFVAFQRLLVQGVSTSGLKG
ncbi:carbohydrate ABC transporter permease [Actinoplanes sichuanensis]|uniref:Carbohydrate ABC transporter permease n=1 Tax=Actinoplanes sichuanensis TaxID=512349 RepID=A0ABW4AXZ1_9ACTN|nr:carbohydrate ABC transporter permease [Actinoplanes sichuanensis]BEL04450.1 carbohydrate ABC transporter permease [Actinoplanes sichuanensis]